MLLWIFLGTFGVGVRTQELVALSGAHTLGNKGFGNPNLFDNSYFQILLQKPWENAGTSTLTSPPIMDSSILLIGRHFVYDPLL